MAFIWLLLDYLISNITENESPTISVWALTTVLYWVGIETWSEQPID